MTEEKKFAVGAGITSACNMGCNFCYSVERRNDTPDIHITKWMNFFSRNQDKISDVNFGTGENTLVNSWFDLVEFIGDLNADIGQALTTNGSLVSRIGGSSRKDNIVTSNLSDVDVSLDYANEHRHNSFRGNRNAFNMALDTLAYCKESGFNTTVVVMGIDETLALPNMEGIFSIAAEYDALVRVNIYRPVNKGNGLMPPSFDVLMSLFDWVAENHYICSLSDPLFSSVLSKQEPQSDPSGKSSVRILPDGSVYPSTYLISPDFCLGNIDDEEIFDSLPRSKVVDSLKGLPKECGGCDVVEGCGGGTIDRRILWNGTTEIRDPYCPKNFGLGTSLRSYDVHPDGFSSIHDGYLPTIFFKPKIGK
jgi:radical SAM protein with 4Fe4S-binding SPASM domain